MSPAGDRRQELRREEDEEIRVILARYGVRLDQHDKLLDSVGSSVGHLVQMDSRVDEHERRLDKHESEIAASLLRLEAQVISLHDKLDADMDGLKETFIPRTEMPALYVPRKEHERRWQMKLLWPTVALAVLMILSQMVILGRALLLH